MPSWGELLNEIQASAVAHGGQPQLDDIRRRYIRDLSALTGRSVIVYASDFLNKPGPQSSINLGDMQGLMEVFRDLPGPDLDLILHSPGGQAEATDRLLRYLRTKFSHIRVIVPFVAMSAATMWAMGADEIVMGKHSQLGPIDPQVSLPTGMTVPAGALLDQFKEASDECASDPSRITAWLPTLQQYGPGLLNVCEAAGKLSKQLVAEWLEAFMFRGDADAHSKAEAIAEWLGDDHVHLSHGRAITRDALSARGIKIVNLEDDPDFQDAVLSVHHMVMHTFSATPVMKLVENNLDRAWVQLGGMQVMLPPGAMPPGMPPQMPPGAQPPGP